jgi:hypothetical protein
MLTTTSQQLAWLFAEIPAGPVRLHYRLERFTRLGHELH